MKLFIFKVKPYIKNLARVPHFGQMRGKFNCSSHMLQQDQVFETLKDKASM